MNMTLLAATPGVYYAFQNSDTVGKGIVVILILGSMLTWTLMIDKFLHLRQAKRLSKRFLEVFKVKNKNLVFLSIICSTLGVFLPDIILLNISEK